MKLGYLGPEGTFTEAAVRRYAPNEEAIPYIDVPAALAAVRAGEVDVAMVPIENSVEGGVNATIDSLGVGDPLVIVGEILLPVTFVLAVPNSGTRDIRRIGTHPHAWAQCRKWVARTMENVEHTPTSSTAAAAQELAAGTTDYDAALCSALSAEKYGLDLIATDIADNRNAVTRFVAVARPSRLPAPTGADKTTLMVHLGHNEAGGLLEMLEQFSVRGVNLSRIESRPIGDALGRYAFSMDAEGHVMEERLQAVLIGLHRVCPVVRFIGSYPAADGRRPTLRVGTSDKDFRAAREWVSSILNQTGSAPEFSPVPFQQAPESPQSAFLPDFETMDSKSRMLVAALREFSQYGYDGASMRRVAGAARVDPGLVPYHFGGKSGLFRAAVMETFPDRESILGLLAPVTPDSLAPIGEMLASPAATGIRASVVALVRTALSPTAHSDSVQIETAQWLAGVIAEAIGTSSRPAVTATLTRIVTGLIMLRDVVPINPLRQLGSADITRLLAARLALVDPSIEEDPFAGFGGASALDSGDTFTSLEPEPIDDSLPARERILLASRRLLARWGFNGASLRDIARDAGCDISLVHYYFGSKTGLMEAVVNDLKSSTEAWQSEYMESDLPPNPEDGLRDLIQMLTRTGSRESVRALLISAANPGSPKVSEMVRAFVQTLFDLGVGTHDNPAVELGLHLHSAEVIGTSVLSEVLHPVEQPKIPAAQTQSLARVLIDGASRGESLEELGGQALSEQALGEKAPADQAPAEQAPAE
ncbi:MAG: prephenate dehydratase, partial [bacterium]|nr:prephenate dehydratase [bacterium]